MRERPILFSGPMVREILAGTKTQTRRVVKGVKHFPEWGSAVGMVGGAWRYGSPAALGLSHRGDHWSVTLDADHLSRMCTREAYGWGAGSGCPYGVPGDRLWVRETSAAIEQPDGLDGVRYSADSTFRPIESTSEAADRWLAMNHYGGKRSATVPAIHMPRWASRITLEITGVRVERLQAISDIDAKAEGCEPRQPLTASGIVIPGQWRLGFRDLWQSINGPSSWDANPWVWVVEFRRCN